MPGFILDVHGLEKTFKIPGGMLDAVNRLSIRLVEGQTFSITGESNNPGLVAAVISVNADRVIFPIVSCAAQFLVKGV